MEFSTFAEVENATCRTGPRSSAVTSVYDHTVLGLMPRSLCARVLGWVLLPPRVPLLGTRLLSVRKGTREGKRPVHGPPAPRAPHRPPATWAQPATVFDLSLQLITIKTYIICSLLYLQIKHSSTCKKYTPMTSTSLHLHVPWNLVLNPLCMLGKYSHCHQFSNQVDKENMVGRPPKVVQWTTSPISSR